MKEDKERNTPVEWNQKAGKPCEKTDAEIFDVSTQKFHQFLRNEVSSLSASCFGALVS